MSKPSLVIRLLGPPEVTVAGTPLRVDTRKALAVLAYLVTTDQPQAREHLAVLLWPDADDASARGALRRTLSTLKTALGGRHLVVERGSVRLERADVWADVWQLRSATDGGSADAAAAAAALRGEFLAGFALRDAPDFDDWTLAEADAWRQRSITILDRVAAQRAAEGELAAAIEMAQRRMELDRLDEGGHRQLMTLYARSGARGAALRQHRSCVRLLSEELGVEPLPATTALHDAILAGTVVDEPGATPPFTAGQAEPLPLVGRDVQLRQLREAWRSPVARLVLIEGEAGIGKTRLASELAAMVERDGGRMLELRGYPGNRATPYAPVVEVLERELHAHPDLVAALDGHVRAEVARLVPGTAAGHVDAQPLDGPGAEARFTDALATTIAALAGDLLVVDDAQWVDPATLALAAQVARRANDDRVLVAICRRPIDPTHDQILPAIVEARRRDRLVAVGLGRLTPAEVHRIVTRLGMAVDADALHVESAGVPFYLAERLAALAAGAAPDEIPAGIRDLVRTRVAPCSPATQQVLAASAIIGRSFDPSLVREVSGRSADEVADAVDELAAHRLVVARRGSLEIDHELTRSVVLDDLGLGRRRVLHRRSAEALIRRAGRRRAAADVAGHLQAAGDDSGAAEWYGVAGERAEELHAHAEAIEHFRAALALAPVPDPRLHERIGERWMLLGRYEDAATAFEAAAAGAPLADAWRSELGLARAHRRLGNLALADAHLDAVGATLAPDRAAERSAVHVERALIADRRDRDLDAAFHADAALALARELGRSLELAQALNLCGLLARHRGELALARRHLTEGLDMASTLPGPAARMASLNNLALLEVAEGSTDAAEARLRQALILATTIRDRHHEAALRNNLADVLNAAGRRQEAITEIALSATILADLGGVGAAQRDPSPEVWRLVDW